MENMYIDIHTHAHTYIVGVGPFLCSCWDHISVKNKHGSEQSHFRQVGDDSKKDDSPPSQRDKSFHLGSGL